MLLTKNCATCSIEHIDHFECSECGAQFPLGFQYGNKMKIGCNQPITPWTNCPFCGAEFGESKGTKVENKNT